MVEISSSANPLASVSVSTLSSDAVQTLQAAVTSMPDQLLAATYQLEITALLQALTSDQTLVLQTSSGQISLAQYLQAVPAAVQPAVQQQITDLIQTQKPVTVIIQPPATTTAGQATTAPRQAILFLPPLVTPNSNSSGVSQPITTGIAAIPNPQITARQQSSIQPAATTGLNNAPILQNQILPQPVRIGITLTVIPLPQAGNVPAAMTPPPAVLSSASLPTSITEPSLSVIPPAPAVAPATSQIAPMAQKTVPQPVAPTTVSPARSLNTDLLPSQQPPVTENRLPYPPAPTAPAGNVRTPSQVTQPATPPLFAPQPDILPVGKPITVVVQNIIPPSSGAATFVQPPANSITPQTPIETIQPPPSASTETVITVRVTDKTVTGNIILQTNNHQDLYVRDNIDAPAGSVMIIKVKATDREQPVLVTGAQNSALPATSDLFLEIQNQNNLQSLPQDLFQTLMPQFNQHLGSALVFFLSAFRPGSNYTRQWLGDSLAKALAFANKSALLTKAAAELSALATPAHDMMGNAWVSYALPLFDQQQAMPLFLYMRGASDAPDKQPPDTSAKTTYERFLINFQTSRLGLVQLDGYTQQQKLDLILRSPNTLPPFLEQDIRQHYQSFLEISGYKGSLAFRTDGYIHLQKTSSGDGLET